MKHAHKTMKTLSHSIISEETYARTQDHENTIQIPSLLRYTSHVNICPLGSINLTWFWNLGSTLRKATMVNLLSNTTFYNWNKMGPTASFKVQSGSSK
jgi:hypothetical protein